MQGKVHMKLLFKIIAAVTLVCASGLVACNRNVSTPERQSLHEKVINAGVIRASYANYPPYCIKDPNSGELSGACVEILNEAGKRLGLKVDWVEEVGWGAIFEGLNSGRHDIFGAGIWRNSSRGKVGDFSRPLFFNVIKVYGRPGDSRFSDNLEAINDPSVRISTMDGAIEDVIASTDFPKAKRVSVPQLNPWSDVLLNIDANKADLTFAEPSAVNLYLEKNPGTIAELHPDHPLRVFANTFAFRLGESEFKAMLDASLEEMLNDGTIERVLKKYERYPGEFYRVAKPYAQP